MCKYEEPITTPEEFVEVFNKTVQSFEKSNEHVIGFFEHNHTALLELKRLKNSLHRFKFQQKKSER